MGYTNHLVLDVIPSSQTIAEANSLGSALPILSAYALRLRLLSFPFQSHVKPISNRI